MRIMILSPYTNSQLREHLQLKGYGRLTKTLIDKLGLAKSIIDKDIAPWVGQLIEELEKQPNIELFSVSPQIKMVKKVESFQLGGTKYYFYSPEFSSAIRLLKNYRLWKVLQNCGKRVLSIADKIKPDIVIAYGTENPVISVSQLWLAKRYPLLCVLQTVYNNPDRKEYVNPSKLIQDLERDIVSHVPFIGTSSRVYRDLLLSMNKRVQVIEYKYPQAALPSFDIPPKKYDFVNYAFNMDARKGDDDSIKALAIVKNSYPHVTLNIAGGMSSERRADLENLIADLGIKENVSFTPMFERKEDMYRHILHARFALLPVKLDLISTTTREAMYYGLPVITNRTPATPMINKDKQCVILAEKDNVESLAECMKDIMSNEQLAEQLAINAHEFMMKQIDNRDKMKQIMGALNAIIENFHHCIPVPEIYLLK